MRTRCTSQVLDHTLLGRYVKHLTSCGDDHPLALGRKANSCDVVATLFQLRAGKDVIGCQGHVHLLGLLLGGIQFIEVTPILKHDGFTEAAGELAVIFSEVRHLARLFCLCVIGEQVHRVVTVGEEEDLIANPHREDVLRLVVGDVLHLLGSGIIHPDVVSHTALVVFPGTEFTHYPIVGKLFTIG